MKAVMHAHSDWSYDGSWSLQAIARLYGAMGVDAVLLTEHDTGFSPESFGRYREKCAEASTERCVLVPGIEYSSPDNAVHILTWGLEVFLKEHRPTLETLRCVKEAGGVAVFAHPIRRDAWQQFDDDWTPYLSGIELWNRKSDGLAACRQAYDLIRKTQLPATVGQDFHVLRHCYPLTVCFPAEARTERELVAAIGNGDFQPRAFGRPILDEGGNLLMRPHDQLEQARSALRDFIRRRPASS